MTCLRLCSTIVLSATLILCAPLMGQTPPAPKPSQGQPGGAPGGPRAPLPAPTNLQVLPKTMTGDEVDKLMREYRGQLGVDCAFCHAQDPTTHRNDPASDANPVKETARYMISMTADLNEKYLEEMPGRRYADPITCGTCHRGEKHPSVFIPKELPRQGGPGAAASAAGTPPK